MRSSNVRRAAARSLSIAGLSGAALLVAGTLLSGCTVSPTAPRLAAAASPAAAQGATRTADVRRGFRPEDYGVSASPRVVADGQPVPRGGGRAMVGRPYQVAGKTYTPAAEPNYTTVGLASWYGSDFHGRRTANGEVFDMNALSAAHPTMPLPSYARVTNMENGASVLVRVNDRGPYHRNRVIDVSERAADLLGMTRTGVAEVKVEYVGPARLDGRDERMLMASYQPPGGRVDRTIPATMLAFNDEAPVRPSRAAAADRPVQVASLRSARAVEYNPFADGQADEMFGDLPRGMPPAHRSYAAEPVLSPAQQAAAMLARGELRLTAPREGAAERVQVGVFGQRANAERIAALLGGYGEVTTEEITDGGKTRWSVRVAAASRQQADSAVAAAIHAGAKGAYRVTE